MIIGLIYLCSDSERLGVGAFNGVKWLEGYRHTISVLVVPGGCSWEDEYPGATVREQANHGILARHRMRSVSSYND